MLECTEIAPDLVTCLVRYSADMPGGHVEQEGMQLIRKRNGKTVEVRNFAEDLYASDAAFSPESSVDRTRRGYAAFAQADLETIAGMFSPDIVWHVPGRSSLAGEYRGIEAVFGTSGSCSSAATARSEPSCWSAARSPGVVAALARLTGDMPAGSLDARGVTIFREDDDGRVVEVLDFSEDQVRGRRGLRAGGHLAAGRADGRPARHRLVRRRRRRPLHGGATGVEPCGGALVTRRRA